MLIILVSRHITQFFDNDQSLLLTNNNYIHHGWFLLSVKFSNLFFLRRNFISSKELQAAKLLWICKGFLNMKLESWLFSKNAACKYLIHGIKKKTTILFFYKGTIFLLQ